MKIGIDARLYGPHETGLGRYTQKLIENLEREDSKNDYVVFLRKEAMHLYEPKNPRFQKRVADFRWYGFLEQIAFPWVLFKEKLDLAHFPHFNVPLLYRKPFLVTIHDLILFRFHTKRSSTLTPLLYYFKYAAYKMVIRSAVRHAKKIIAVSACTKKDIVRFLKVPEDKVAVVYEGCDPALAFEKTPPLPANKKITKPYILYVGNAYPHKNLEMLARTWTTMTENEELDMQLVLVGKEDYFYRRLRTSLPPSNNAPSIVFYGYAQEEELPALYRNASLYVFPSLLEGFGLPPLEAMSYGLPVVAASNSCLPEILEEAAIYFDPKNHASLKTTILRVLGDASVRETLRKKGYEQIKKYRWENVARETLDVYENALVKTP